MMPLIKTAALCQQTRSLIERSKLELSKLGEKHIETNEYMQAARTYLQTATRSPLGQSYETQAGPSFSLPTIRGDTGWNKRASETRCFAERIEDAGLKREMMALAEQYDRLGGCSPATNLPPAAHVPAFGAIAA